MTWGIKISKPGKDVKTCNNDELVMSSEFNCIKIAYSAAPGTYGTYTHGLGYAPAFMVSEYLSETQGTFVGQNFSAFEATFYSTSTIFYYYNTCRYFLFYQDTA